MTEENFIGLLKSTLDKIIGELKRGWRTLNIKS